VRLYTYWRSSCSWRVRIALHLKGLPFESAPVHLLKDGGEQNRDEYRQKNPLGTVPLLEWTEAGQVRRLSQSLAILGWLEERHPRPALLPDDPWLRARARMLAELVNSGIQPMQNTSVMQHLKGALGVDAQAWAAHWVVRGLTAFQASASETAGRFCVGDAVSWADLCLVPQLYHARRFGVDLGPLGLLTRIEQACSQLPAFQAAHADRQPDTPPA
jgi:maleylpyruvate isomerase